MSDDKTKGNSGNTSGGATPPGNGSEQPKGKLESLLQEWDSKNAEGTDSGKPDNKGKPAGTGDEPESPKDSKPAAWAAIDDFDYDRLLERMKGDLDVEDFEVDGWLKNRAVKDPRIIDYFNNRHSSELAKNQFREIAKTLVPEFREYAKKRFAQKPDPDDNPDPGAGAGKGAERSDDKGLGAAVRSSREAKPSSDHDDVDVSRMSGHEFAQHRAGIFKDMKEGKLTPQSK